jgi:hypothetical protein
MSIYRFAAIRSRSSHTHRYVARATDNKTI